jgi:hypothetical protein
MIGAKYVYPEFPQREFLLTEIRAFVYVFACGHWCTDCVFVDLIQTTLF